MSGFTLFVWCCRVDISVKKCSLIHFRIRAPVNILGFWTWTERDEHEKNQSKMLWGTETMKITMPWLQWGNTGMLKYVQAPLCRNVSLFWGFVYIFIFCASLLVLAVLLCFCYSLLKFLFLKTLTVLCHWIRCLWCHLQWNCHLRATAACESEQNCQEEHFLQVHRGCSWGPERCVSSSDNSRRVLLYGKGRRAHLASVLEADWQVHEEPQGWLGCTSSFTNCWLGPLLSCWGWDRGQVLRWGLSACTGDSLHRGPVTEAFQITLVP